MGRDEEKEMEENAVHDGSVAEKNESEELNDPDDTKGQKNDQNTDKNNEAGDDNDESPSLFTGTGSSKGLLARFRGSSAAKKWMVGAGAGLMVGFVGGIIALITFLMPFKVTHMINQIEQRLGEVPQYAVERRLEYYMNRYLILRTLAATPGIGEDNINRNNYVYLGDGVFSTLYTNWRGSNLEGKLAQQGWRLETRTENAGQIFGRRRVNPTDWVLVNDNVSVNSPLHRQNLDSKQARAFIKEFATSETKSSQVFKRYNMRKMLKRYYGVNNWKFFETERSNVRKSYLEKKLAIKRTLVDKTVGSISTRYGKYLNCLLEGGNTCRTELGKGANQNPRTQPVTETDPDTGEVRVVGGDGADEATLTDRNAMNNLGSEATEFLTEGVVDVGDTAERAVANNIIKQIQELGMKKILASFVAGIGLLETISQVVNSLESGALNIVIYDKNSQQYANFAAPVLSMADQIRSSEVNIDDARILNEMFNNFQASPVYQTEFGSRSGTVSAASVNGGQFRRDCNGDGDTTDSDDLLEPGETVCPEKRLVQDKTTFTNNQGWKILAEASKAYRGSVGKVVGFFTDIVENVTDALGIDSLIQGAMDALGISDLVASGFRAVMNRIAGPVVTGVEVEEDAYDAFYAGMAVNYSSIGGGVGATREGTVGGGYLSDEQVLAIRNEGVEERIYAKQFESIADRYFSLENTNSLATKTLMSVPTSFSQLASSLAEIPTLATHGFGTLLTQSAGAQTVNSTNPFHAIWYGYPTNHPIFTANDGSGMDEDQIEEQYKCSLPVNERPQNVVNEVNYQRPDDIPFDIAMNADPCLLEQVVGDVGRRAFDKSYDEQIEIATPPVAGGDIAGQDTSNLPCPVSPTIRDAGIESEAYKDGVRYTIRLCSVHGVRLNSIIAKSFDDMFTNMASQGFTIRGTGGFRDMASQIAGYANGRGKGTFSKPGFSNHQFGTAADISCQGGGASYQAGTGRGLQSFLAGVAAYPCLDFVHKNSYKYGLYLQCDGQSSSGGEIRANSGGCEWWHVSPTGG
jgi:hypothetical protein